MPGFKSARVNWQDHGVSIWHVHFLDYLEKDHTINSDHYVAQLMRLKDEIAENAPDHRAMKTMVNTNYISNYLRSHRIHQLWYTVTFSSTQTSNKLYLDRDLDRIKRGSPSLTSKISRSTRKSSKCWIMIPSLLKETILMNNNCHWIVK